MEIPNLFNGYIRECRQQATKLRVVFVDGDDQRIVSAANYLHKQNICDCILVTREVIAKSNLRNKFCELLLELRKEKNLSRADAELLVQQPRYYGSLLLLNGHADIIIAGANLTTKDALIPFLQLFRDENKTFISSLFFMIRGEEVRLVTDCALNFVTSSKILAKIAENVYQFHKTLFIHQARVALLSFSTNGSGKGSNVDVVRGAFRALIETHSCSEKNFYGEIQFDAAVSKQVAKVKRIASPVAGNTNCFVFPSMNAGNIGYKIMKHDGEFLALGPILLNTKYCCSDLSRGCTAKEVILTAILLCKKFINEGKNG